jgi:hypothetical protein
MSYQKELNLKAWGIEATASAHEPELRLAQDMALKIAALKGEITVDDVRESLPNLAFGNWAGSIFKGKEWVCVGFIPSRHKNSHARIVRVWSRRLAA